MLDIVITGADLEHDLLLDLTHEVHPARTLYRPSEPSLRLEDVPDDADLTHLEAEAARHNADFFVLPAGLSIKSFKAFFFDMDSTLIENECIDDMAFAAGCFDEVCQMTKEAMEGKWPFAENLQRRVKLLAGAPLSVVDHSVESARFSVGAEVLMKFARRNGLALYVVSGGFTLITRPIAKKLGMTGAVSNELVIENGLLTGDVVGPAGGRILDARGKRRAVEVLSQLHGASLREVLCCGDGANDVEMIRSAGLGVAFHAKPVVQQLARYRINHSGLDAIMLFFRESWRDALPFA